MAQKAVSSDNMALIIHTNSYKFDICNKHAQIYDIFVYWASIIGVSVQFQKCTRKAADLQQKTGGAFAPPVSQLPMVNTLTSD